MERKLDIKKLIKQYAIAPNKSLGQNFINDLEIIEREVSYGGVKESDTVLEIGPGLGQLTELLAKRARRVIAIEKDSLLRKSLERVVESNPNVEIIYGDFLEAKLPQFDVAFGNLPYNVALPITFKLMEYNFRKAVLMAQEELVTRIAAREGQKGYCRLGVFLQRISRIKILEKVRRANFFPSPNVDSLIFSIEKTKPSFNVKDEDFFMKVLKYMFYQTNRETNFRDNIVNLKYRGLPEEKILLITSKLPMKLLTKKPYQTPPEQFGQVSDVLFGIIGKGKYSNKLGVDYRKKMLR